MGDITRTADSGFAVGPAVLNRPVREVDRARNREMWLGVLAVAVLAVALLANLWQQAAIRQLGRELETLQKARAAEEKATYRLRVDLETLRSLKRIEQLAPQLNLVAPSHGDAIVIERVRPTPPPAKGLVVRR